MKIALVGYGKMGKMVEQVAQQQQYTISAILDQFNNRNGEGISLAALGNPDVAIEFSTPDTVFRNIEQLLSLSIPVVVGTTGWYERIDEVREIVLRTDGSLVYSPNFSLGVNIFFRIVKFAATQLSKFDDFDPYLFESHHRMKLDAPSGTALNLESILRSTLGDRAPKAVSLRAGFIPGSHEVGFDSTSETVRIVHSARNREPFARGALLAAKLIQGRRGLYQFNELI